MTECVGCGGCCDPVTSIVSPLDAARMPPWAMDDRTRRWYREDLTPLKRRDGLARAPHLTQGGRTAFGYGPDGEVMVAVSMFYECRHFDRETRRCGDYDNRPQPCRDYPWYQGVPDSAAALPFECSYRADIGQPVAAPTRRT